MELVLKRFRTSAPIGSRSELMLHHLTAASFFRDQETKKTSTQR